VDVERNTKSVAGKRTEIVTDIEKAMSKILDDLGFTYYEQYGMHPYIVDFYLPEFMIVVEADGKVWHSKRKDRKRDLKLMGEYKVRVLHFTDEEILIFPETTKGIILNEIMQTKYQEV
jgi:very-short-patch-repair endonuclease